MFAAAYRPWKHDTHKIPKKDEHSEGMGPARKNNNINMKKKETTCPWIKVA
jgi:hypothetical protein